MNARRLAVDPSPGILPGNLVTDKLMITMPTEVHSNGYHKPVFKVGVKRNENLGNVFYMLFL
jgi:hypothetical protein